MKMSKVKMKKKSNFAEKTIGWLVVLFCYSPVLVLAADWDAELLNWGRIIRIGMYSIAGVLGLITLLWSGIQWMISRANGDHSHTFMDYMKQVGVLVIVGGTLALGAAAWQVFGTGDPNA
jgi:hypothetical protein